MCCQRTLLETRSKRINSSSIVICQKYIPQKRKNPVICPFQNYSIMLYCTACQNWKDPARHLLGPGHHGKTGDWARDSTPALFFKLSHFFSLITVCYLFFECQQTLIILYIKSRIWPFFKQVKNFYLQFLSNLWRYCTTNLAEAHELHTEWMYPS